MHHVGKHCVALSGLHRREYHDWVPLYIIIRVWVDGGLGVAECGLYICWLGLNLCINGRECGRLWFRLTYLKYWLKSIPNSPSSLFFPFTLGQPVRKCTWILSKLLGLHDPRHTRNFDFCLGGRCWESRDKVQGTEDRKVTSIMYFMACMCPVQWQDRTVWINKMQNCHLIQIFSLHAQLQIPVGPLSEFIIPAILSPCYTS